MSRLFKHSKKLKIVTVCKKQILDATSWKIEAAFAESKLPEIKDNQTESKESKESKDEKSGNCSKEFRPSPPLGIIEEERPQHIPGTFDNFVPIKKPASGFHR